MHAANSLDTKVGSIINYHGRAVAKIQRTRVINAHMQLQGVYWVATALDRFLTIEAKVLGIFVMKECKFHSEL